MASIGAVAIKRGAATARLISAMSTIARELGVEPAVLPTARDVTFEHAAQLEALAEWAEGVADALDPKSEASNSLLKDYSKRQKAALDKTADYDRMRNTQLWDLAIERGYDDESKLGELNRDMLITFLRQQDATQSSVGEPISNAEAASLPFAETAPDYDAMTRADALKRAQDAGMPVTAKTSKAEAVDYLQAASGMTEDQQALDADAGPDVEG